MRIIAAIIRGVLFVAEKVLWELALLAALFSTTEGGTFFNRAVGGMMDNIRAIYGFAKAYVTHMKFNDFIMALGDGLEDALEAIQINVESSPRKVLLAMFITFVAWKLFAYVLKLIRKKVFKHREGDTGTVKKPGKKGGGKTYEQLYNNEQPPAHTPPVPRTPSGHTDN